MKSRIADVLSSEKTNYEVTINGWVRTFRNNQFIALNDGSCLQTIQVVLDLDNADSELLRQITTGAALSVTGEVVPSQGKGQHIEIKASDIEVVGTSDPGDYPLQPKKHSLAFPKSKSHMV